MKIEIKFTGALYAEMIQDLTRPHPFASERIGFALGRLASLSDQGSLVLLNRYHPIPDSEYLDDATVGARIGPDALTWAMQEVYRGRPAHEGVFHVHLHSHQGQTGMSWTDQREIPRMIPGFRSVGRDGAHGILILSLDHGTGWVALPENPNDLQVSSVTVIGCPIRVFEPRSTK